MAFEEVESSAWTYSNDGDSIEGILVRVQENIGVNKSKLYSIDTNNGIKSVWGSAILDDKLAILKVGDLIRITYKGLGEAKKGKNAPKIFSVMVDKSINN
jgi:hypothetical protein